MAEVPLVDLEVILRYSLAIRQETADAHEVLEALDQSRTYVIDRLRSAGEDVTGHTDEPRESEDVGQTDEPSATPEPTPEPPPEPVAVVEPAPVPEPAPESIGNGEVDLENLPSPLPKEEAAARRAARRARRSKS